MRDPAEVMEGRLSSKDAEIALLNSQVKELLEERAQTNYKMSVHLLALMRIRDLEVYSTAIEALVLTKKIANEALAVEYGVIDADICIG